MQELVIQSSKGNDVTTSLIVAEVFGKEHKNVVRGIESLSCSENFNKLNFEPIEYIDSRGRTQKAYEMTKDGFTFLAMGYTGKVAAKFKEDFINAFNAMEKQLRQSPDSRIMGEIERRLLQASQSWLTYMGQLQSGSKTKMNLTSYVSLVPAIDDSMTIEQKISQLIHFIQNNVSGALYANARMIEMEEEQKKRESGEQALDNLFSMARNPNHYSKEYFVAVMDSFNTFLREEFHQGKCIGGTHSKLLERIEAARTLYVKEEARL